MSFLKQLHGIKNNEFEDICNDVIENITGIISSRAPILLSDISSNSIVSTSILTLGLANTMRYQKKYHGKFVFEEIIGLLQKFEPRLKDIQIESDDDDDNSNLFHFKIKATIFVNEQEDTVLFDSCLDFGSNMFSVRKSNFV